MLSQPVIFDYWRNYKPLAPDLEWLIADRKTWTYDLRPLLLQGSRDEETNSPTLGILEKVPAQRGWKCSPMIIGQPSRGTVRINSTFDGFEYIPRPGFVGFDCFNYVLTNGTQQSDVAKVTVEVKPWYSHRLIVIRDTADKSNHTFKLIDNFPEGAEKVYMQTYEWSYTNLKVTKEGQASRIFSASPIVKKTYVGSFITGRDCGTSVSFLPYMGPPAKDVPNIKNILSMPTPSDNLIGFDGNSDILYHPRNLRGIMKVKVKLFTETITRSYSFPCGRGTRTIVRTHVDLTKFHEIEYDFADYYGQRWHESGNVLIPGIKH